MERRTPGESAAGPSRRGVLRGIGAAALSAGVLGIGGVASADARLPNEIAIKAEAKTIRYSIEVSGRIEAGEWFDKDDTVVDGTIVDGAMDELSDVDNYYYSGSITRFEVTEGAVTVLINGKEVADPTGGGSSKSGSSGTYALAQGDSCIPITPLSGDVPVDELYGYQLPSGKWGSDLPVPDDGGPYYSSTGTESLQRHDTSIVFLYQGPDALSLVVVHGKAGQSEQEGGSATFTFTGLPSDGEWVVKDDRYLDRTTGQPAVTNYDEWNVDSSIQSISWTWGQHGTDGGAFQGLGSDVDFTLEPAFNDRAKRLKRNYPGEVVEWQVLSGDMDDPDRRTLDMETPVRITSGSCD